MRTAAEVQERLDSERERVARLSAEQPGRAKAVARAVADDAGPSVVRKLRAERDGGEREIAEAGDVVRLLEQELEDAERREEAERQAKLEAEAVAEHGAAVEQMTVLVQETRAACDRLLPLWRAAVAANERARQAAWMAGDKRDWGDGVWPRSTPVRPVMQAMEAFVRLTTATE